MSACGRYFICLSSDVTEQGSALVTHGEIMEKQVQTGPDVRGTTTRRADEGG